MHMQGKTHTLWWVGIREGRLCQLQYMLGNVCMQESLIRSPSVKHGNVVILLASVCFAPQCVLTEWKGVTYGNRCDRVHQSRRVQTGSYLAGAQVLGLELGRGLHHTY